MSLKPSEDSYEAAMRAADALFSPSSDRADSPVEKEPANLAQPFFDSEQPDALVSPAPVSAKNGGRILRVIDEPPAPEYAALEAERAPKRRGRKPGSKNKPKVAAIAVGPASPSPVDAVSEPAVFQPSSGAPRKKAACQPAATQAAALAATSAPGDAPRTPKRFPWGRDRLRPGEDWKRRRLPRVCW